ncbi:MAG TPA: RDD family protein [Thermoanaerobaculia bacterium]|jgi:uncharacterized RDD family membrane protein YckC
MEKQVVFYSDGDYLGVMRRLLIDGVDTFVAIAASWLVWLMARTLAPERYSALIWLSACTGVFFAYFVVLKGSRFRTLGYMLAGAQIVSLNGQRPSYATLLGRLCFVVLGPVNFVFDLLWVSSDPRRQALRDKLAHTYVVRRTAVPAGEGRLVYGTYMVFGWTILCAEVKSDYPSAVPNHP